MVDHIKRDVSRLVEEFSSKTDENPFSKVIPALMKKGLDNVNLSMFSEEKKKDVLGNSHILNPGCDGMIIEI